MTALELLKHIRSLGGSVRIEPDGALRYRAPKSLIPELTRLKSEVADLLRLENLPNHEPSEPSKLDPEEPEANFDGSSYRGSDSKPAKAKRHFPQIDNPEIPKPSILRCPECWVNLETVAAYAGHKCKGVSTPEAPKKEAAGDLPVARDVTP